MNQLHGTTRDQTRHRLARVGLEFQCTREVANRSHGSIEREFEPAQRKFLLHSLLQLREIARVSRRHVILSVPNEPLWRVLNMPRGAYLPDLGNTPGHLQHWSRRAFVRFVSQELRIDRVRSTLPWTVVAASVVK